MVEVARSTRGSPSLDLTSSWSSCSSSSTCSLSCSSTWLTRLGLYLKDDLGGLGLGLRLGGLGLPDLRAEDDARCAPCAGFLWEAEEEEGVLVKGKVMPEGYLVWASSDLGMDMPSCLVRQSMPSTLLSIVSTSTAYTTYRLTCDLLTSGRCV